MQAAPIMIDVDPLLLAVHNRRDAGMTFVPDAYKFMAEISLRILRVL
jgi:hypothetical protein